MQPSISGTAPSPSLTPAAATPQQISSWWRRPPAMQTAQRWSSRVILSRSQPILISTPIPTWRPGRQRLIGYLRSAALTPATSRGTGRSSMRSLSVASAPGCEHVRAASLVKRQLLCRASGDERIRVGNADPQFAHRPRGPRLGLPTAGPGPLPRQAILGTALPQRPSPPMTVRATIRRPGPTSRS